MTLTPRERYLRNTALARRDNTQVRRLRRNPRYAAAVLPGFVAEHKYHGWSRMLQRLTDPNRLWVAAQTRGMDAGAFEGHTSNPHDCYLSR